MRPRFLSPNSIVYSFLLLCLVCGSFAADKKRKNEPPPPAKNNAKNIQKAEPKKNQLAARDARAAKGKADKGKADEGKQKLVKGKTAPAQREAKAGKGTPKDALAKREKTADKKGKKDDQREKKEKLEALAKDKNSKRAKTENIAKKATAASEKNAKPDTKLSAKAERPDPKLKKEAQHKTDTATQPVAKNGSAVKMAGSSTRETGVRELPPTNFNLRPVAKVSPRVELKFSLAKAFATNFDAPPPAEPKGPDVIEVIEHDSPEVRKLDDIYRQEVKPLAPPSLPSVSKRKIDIKKMDADRISQIQEALSRRGYYTGATNGIYDDATQEAMRKFQLDHRIDVTGFATAQSLKLLGLMDFERRFE